MTTDDLPREELQRIALYSHDTMGIGHVRRNLLIARALAGAGQGLTILLVAGAREASVFELPPGVGCLTLPSLCKQTDGCYRSRHLRLSLQQATALRSRTILAALDEFAPDVLIADKVPRGVSGELDATLQMLRRRGRTRCVLGLRDILDDPRTVREEWRTADNESAIRAYYDAVWIYGDALVYDPVLEYGFSPAVAARVRYAGYLNPCLVPRLQLGNEIPGRAGPDDLLARLGLPPGRLALCVVGGGEDGDLLAEAFCQTQFPTDMSAVLVTGPFMRAATRARLYRQESRQPRMRVLEFVTDPERLMQRADRLIAMGGYNTICEAIALGKQALIVPRTRPRTEQLIRAERFRDLNLLDLLPPDQLNPANLRHWLSRDLPDRPAGRERIDFGGLQRLPLLLSELMAGNGFPSNPPPTPNEPELSRAVT